MTKPSPFLDPGPRTAPGTLAIVVLSRDNLQPVILEESVGAVDGYAEGATLNTRFGSFPHSTLLDIPWGSQVRASAVDTGSRGRKRKRKGATEDDTPTLSQEDGNMTPASEPARKAVTASSGFIHILRPTPELWTSSLPHRTQVVYTPDYSYILFRLRALPGSRLIEAGSGSGSFTHASVRAVYNGHPSSPDEKKGKVFSYEFHEPRFHKMKQELKEHELQDLVHITHRDVYQEGFLIDGESPGATAVFLDLPAPWEALRHLSRTSKGSRGSQAGNDTEGEFTSPLDPKQTVRICTFSPCIEQVTRTVDELRTLGWVDIEMVEMANKRLHVTRERPDNSSPTSAWDAVARLKEFNDRTRAFNKMQVAKNNQESPATEMDIDTPPTPSHTPIKGPSKKDETQGNDKPWMQGRVVHRTESEIKAHTSYLIFATLPQEWSEEDEDAVLAKWPCGKESRTIGNLDKEARKREEGDDLPEEVEAQSPCIGRGDNPMTLLGSSISRQILGQ